MWLSWPHACITPTSWPFHCVFARRLERQVDLLGHRQRIHVGAQRDDRARAAAAEHADDAGRGDAGRDLEAELLSSSAMILAVRVSRLPSSGFW